MCVRVCVICRCDGSVFVGVEISFERGVGK